MATILFEIAHPKHFLQFRDLIQSFRTEHRVVVLARDKDVVLSLLEEHGVPYTRYGVNPKGLFRKLSAAPRRLAEYMRLLIRHRPDVIISKSSPYAALLGRFVGAKTIVMPDSEGVSLNEQVVIPLSDYVITPQTYAADYGPKHLRVPGFFEAGYLHPSQFQSDRNLVTSMGLAEERFALLRFVAWTANHDAGKSGIRPEQQERLVAELEKHIRVFVSCEGAVMPALEKYRLVIPPSKIHTVLQQAALYIGDSQTMATEAALLGTPAIRCNSFVSGKDFSNFEILERDYRLLFNYSNFDDALAKALELAQDPAVKATWAARREAYFASVGDVTAEMRRLVTRTISEQASPAALT